MSFRKVVSLSREMGPSDVLRYALRGARHLGPMQDVPLGAIDPDFELRSDVGIHLAADALRDLVDGIADGLAVPQTRVIFTAQPDSRSIWLASERVVLWTLDSSQLVRDRTVSALVAFVADYQGQLLACVRGTNGGRRPAVPPHPIAAEMWRSLRLAAGAAALPEVTARAGHRLEVVSGAELGNATAHAQREYLEDNLGRRRSRPQ